MTFKYGTMIVVVAALFGGEIATAQAPKQQPTKTKSQPKAQDQSKVAPMATAAMDPATMRDIQATFGFVPQFMRVIPAQLLPAFWQSMKEFELSDETKLDNKTKQLIGLAVAAQIPCDYCVMFHTQGARSNGATDDEIREAIGMAASTRQGSTLLNGAMVDKAQFRKDLDRIMRNSRQQARK